MAKPRILFLGTTGFALPALSLFVEQGYPIVAVVTQPDKPQGRGRSLQPSPVKRFALDRELSLLQPDRVRSDSFLSAFRKLKPDFVVLAAYGQLLPREIVEEPGMPCLNIHPSLLPKYRGAAPIQWALINGKEFTGVTIIRMVAELDAGDILLQESTPIGPEETYDELHERLARKGAGLIVRAVEMVASGTATWTPQDGAAATIAPRLTKEDGRIRWDKDCRVIVNLIRGCSSEPGAFTRLDGKIFKIFRAKAEVAPVGEAPGMVVQPRGEGMAVAARDGYVHLLEVQMENKRRMAIEDFLRGNRLEQGIVLA